MALYHDKRLKAKLLSCSRSSKHQQYLEKLWNLLPSLSLEWDSQGATGTRNCKCCET